MGLLAATMLLLSVQAEEVSVVLTSPKVELPTARYQYNSAPLLTPKQSPRTQWEFPFVTKGYGTPSVGEQDESLRFRVYSQTLETHRELSPKVVRLLLRLWQMNYFKLRLDHAHRYFHQIVDVYLCEQGAAGGEQYFAYDNQERADVNAIHIYDLKSFVDPLEQAREIAHEYGHATFPPVGGFKFGESWANGDLGELLYMRYVRDAMTLNWITSADVMGTDFRALNPYVASQVDDLTISTGQFMPFQEVGLSDEKGRAAYLGVMLYGSVLLPPKEFARVLRLSATTRAKDYIQAFVDAVSEDNVDVTFTPPQLLKGKAFWVPSGSRTVSGAKVYRSQSGWSLVEQTGQRLRIVSKPEPVPNYDP